MTTNHAQLQKPKYNEMKQMLDHLKISYWLVDLDLKILDVNQTFLEMTGATKEKLVGRDIMTLAQPEDKATIEKASDKLFQSDTAVQFEFYVYGKDKKIKTPMMLHLMHNRDIMGRPISCNILFSDISAQKNLEEKERQLFHARRKLRQESLKVKMIGTGKAMENVFYTALRCAEVDTTVLITGETGVGKEVTARSIHSQSNRRNKPFVAVNCGALPGDLLESELFGHVKGAFTGATSNRPGLFREAEGGTLFLDEIGDIEKSLQVKLLRALQENEIRPVGDDKTYKVNLRVICATNLDLIQSIQNGDFRQDLYYRISVVTIHIPPLRERPEDIIKLAEHFITRHPEKIRFSSISPEARRCLFEYHWPGNIRELQNAIEHAMVMSREKILDPDSLPKQIRQSPLSLEKNGVNHAPDIHKLLKQEKIDADKKAVAEALKLYHNNQYDAARHLGISRVTLWRKRKKYNLT